MALPAVTPYPLPPADTLPDNRVGWTVDPSRAVLLVHDLQNYFLSAFRPGTSPVTELLDNVGRLKKDCDRRGVPVVYSAQPGGQTPAERGLQQDFWGPGLPDDAHQKAIAAAVAPGEHDTVLTKWKYSAFVRTDLAERMAADGRDQLIIVGVYAHIGVLMTAADAWMRDIQAFVVADAVADFSEQDHRMALEWAAAKCAVVTTTDHLLEGNPSHGTHL
ncbi:isochorismatase family protein [Streptomyces sp. NPDC002055]|uniref:isochorismatase family protein n=1 Tax=Streptomyces sp. NPDC002055 TaxID=3154534 RepID=UPI003318D9B2